MVFGGWGSDAEMSFPNDPHAPPNPETAPRGGRGDGGEAASPTKILLARVSPGFAGLTAHDIGGAPLGTSRRSREIAPAPQWYGAGLWNYSTGDPPDSPL